MNACTGNNSPIDDITRVVSARSDREGGRLNDRPRVYAKTGRRSDGAGAALFDTRRVIAYGYDHLLRQTSESWYDDVDDQTANLTYTTTYNDLGQVASIGDGATEYEYTYGLFGNLTSTTQDLPGLTPDVKFAYRYDSSGRLAEVAAFIGPVADYVTTYTYDRIGRITRIEQDDAGGKPVAEKRVDFDYDADGDLKEIKRYAELVAANLVAWTDYVFDSIGRLTDLVHARNQITLADYDLTWDAAGRITDFDFTSLIGNAGTAGYAYDNTDQLTGADYDFQTDESYSYDENGNRTLVNGSTSYATGDHNRLSSDGTYNYTYDGEGNVTSKTKISDSTSIQYTWDHRNRLTKVTFKNSAGTATRIVEYCYDNGQRWIRKTLDTNADGTIEQSQIFVHDQGQIVLDFQKTGAEAATTLDLAHRYLWGPAVDQLLADETVDDGTADYVSWVLGDHLNSVRDLAVYDPVTQMVSVVKHVTFDAFGNVTSDSAPSVKVLLLYTARPYDPDSALQNNGFRWYDLSTARWMSADPIGFSAGDVNLYRYVRNCAIWKSDPEGLVDTKDFVLAGVTKGDMAIVTIMNKSILFSLVDLHTDKEFVKKKAEAIQKAGVDKVFKTEQLDAKQIPGSTNTVVPPGNVWTTLTVVRLPVSSNSLDGKCYARFAIVGFVVGLYVDGSDWRYVLNWAGHSSNMLPSDHERVMRAHETDHYKTYETGYHVILKELSGAEAIGFNKMEDAQQQADTYVQQARRYWKHVTEHSHSFDKSPLWVGGQYEKHPVTGVFWGKY